VEELDGCVHAVFQRGEAVIKILFNVGVISGKINKLQ
jgi:hypothetical protein